MINTSLMGYGKVLLLKGEKKSKLEILNLLKAGCSTEVLKERLEAELAERARQKILKWQSKPAFRQFNIV